MSYCIHYFPLWKAFRILYTWFSEISHRCLRSGFFSCIRVSYLKTRVSLQFSKFSLKFHFGRNTFHSTLSALFWKFDQLEQNFLDWSSISYIFREISYLQQLQGFYTYTCTCIFNFYEFFALLFLLTTFSWYMGRIQMYSWIFVGYQLKVCGERRQGCLIFFPPDQFNLFFQYFEDFPQILNECLQSLHILNLRKGKVT